MEVEKPKKDDPERKLSPLWIGYSISAIWLLAFVIYLYRNKTEILSLPSNSLGDLLAGVFAPLAFLWLFVATLLQKDELQAQRAELTLNRKVLSLQAEELRNSVVQLSTQAQILEKQFQSQNKQKALNDVYEGIHGVCSVIISRFGGSGDTLTSAGTQKISSWISEDGLKEMLDNESYAFLIEEVISRVKKRTRRLREALSKEIRPEFRRLPSLSEMERILNRIDIIVAIPQAEGAKELESRFESDLRMPELRNVIAEVKTLCEENQLAKS